MKTGDKHQLRRRVTVLVLLATLLGFLWQLHPKTWVEITNLWRDFVHYDLQIGGDLHPDSDKLALLEQLSVKGRAPKAGYNRKLFGDGWQVIDNCTMRNLILKRDLTDVIINNDCKVMSGVLHDSYSGKVINFTYGPATSQAIQIDHVVAVSDAWQKGAQTWDTSKRSKFYNDPLNLLAVDGEANQAKSDADAASWLPPNKAFRCHYVARQVEVKAKYGIWVTEAEKSVMERELNHCPSLN